MSLFLTDPCLLWSWWHCWVLWGYKMYCRKRAWWASREMQSGQNECQQLLQEQHHLKQMKKLHYLHQVQSWLSSELVLYHLFYEIAHQIMSSFISHFFIFSYFFIYGQLLYVIPNPAAHLQCRSCCRMLSTLKHLMLHWEIHFLLWPYRKKWVYLKNMADWLSFTTSCNKHICTNKRIDFLWIQTLFSSRVIYLMLRKGH